MVHMYRLRPLGASGEAGLGCSASSTYQFSQQGRQAIEPSSPVRASKNSIRQTRFLALLLVALGTMSPAWADVVYVKPNSIAAIHDLLPKDSAGKTPPGVEEATVSGDYVVRGRIVGWFPGDPNLPYSAISEDRQAMPPVGWGGPVIRFRVGLGHSGTGGADGARRPGPTTSKPVVLTIGMVEFGSITHELDHFQDLRWMLSNRDQVLACLLGIRRDQVSWGNHVLGKSHRGAAYQRQTSHYKNECNDQPRLITHGSLPLVH